MIHTTLKHFSRYIFLHPTFAKVADCLAKKEILEAMPSRIEIDGDRLFINVVETTCVAKASQPLEMHRAYIDLHVLLSGEEVIGYKPTDTIANYSQEYKEEGDCALSKEVGDNYIKMSVGDVCIVYPEDAHAPLIGSGPIRKLIIKVKL